MTSFSAISCGRLKTWEEMAESLLVYFQAGDVLHPLCFIFVGVPS